MRFDNKKKLCTSNWSGDFAAEELPVYKNKLVFLKGKHQQNGQVHHVCDAESVSDIKRYQHQHV